MSETNCPVNECLPCSESGPRGVQGDAGANGSPGDDGINAFSFTTADFAMPAVNASVTVAVDESSWIGLNQLVFVEGAGTLQASTITSSTSIALTNVGYTGNAASTTNIVSGAEVSPIGPKGSDAAASALGYILLEEQQANNTAEGTATSGAYFSRILNTEVYDTLNLCVLDAATGIFTLKGGYKYLIKARTPGYQVTGHKSRLYDNTNAAVLQVGSTAYSGNSTYAMTESFVIGRVDIGVDTDYKLQHRVITTQATNGRGIQANIGDIEIYAQVEIFQVL